jgi:hypothetical protein
LVDSFLDLFAHYRYFRRCLDSKTHGVAPNSDDLHAGTDAGKNNLLLQAAGKHKHWVHPFLTAVRPMPIAIERLPFTGSDATAGSCQSLA